MASKGNPFSVGDTVVFAPDGRAMGWHQHSFDRWGIYPGYAGVVTGINADQVEVDAKTESAMHWSQFRPAADVSEGERERMAADYRRRVK